MDGWTTITSFRIDGAPASKANSRRSVPRRDGRGNMFIKSKGAMAFERACATQIPTLRTMLDARGMEVWVECAACYPGLRSDLDMSIVYDQMQGRIYADDVCVTRMTTSRVYGGVPGVDVVVHARPWLIDGKMPVLKVNEGLRRALRAEKLAVPATKPRATRSRKK